jgi:hypothetical protein
MSESISDRLDNAARLIDDFNLAEDAEFFSDPAARIEFLRSLTFEDFEGVARHANDRLQGLEPRY